MRVFIATTVIGVLTLLAGQPCSATTIFDGTFADSDWTHTMVFDSTPLGGTFTAVRADSGGNPKSYQAGSHTWGRGTIYVAHIFTAAGAYNPAVQGAIAHIDFSHDFIVFDESFRAVATALVIKQDGEYFVAPPVPPHFTFPGDAPWTTGSASFTAANFGRLTAAGLAPGAPNLSATGAPIEFGYVSANTTALQDTTTLWGIDNFSVTPVPVPEPPSFMLLTTVAVGLVCGCRLQGRINRRTRPTNGRNWPRRVGEG